MRVLAAIVAVLASGCTLVPVEAWQKGHLAKPAMRFDADHDERIRERTYSSKEGVSGGFGVGGGGCGCN